MHFMVNPEFMSGIMTAIAGFAALSAVVAIGTIISKRFRDFIKRGMR